METTVTKVNIDNKFVWNWCLLVRCCGNWGQISACRSLCDRVAHQMDSGASVAAGWMKAWWHGMNWNSWWFSLNKPICCFHWIQLPTTMPSKQIFQFLITLMKMWKAGQLTERQTSYELSKNREQHEEQLTGWQTGHTTLQLSTF